jgi:hypothetical protein
LINIPLIILRDGSLLLMVAVILVTLLSEGF